MQHGKFKFKNDANKAYHLQSPANTMRRGGVYLPNVADAITVKMRDSISAMQLEVAEY